MISFVCGDPGSGKTTYVEQSRLGGDLVWDMDEIAIAIRATPRYPRLSHELHILKMMRASFLRSIGSARAWVIIASPDEAREVIKEFRIKEHNIVNLGKTGKI